MEQDMIAHGIKPVGYMVLVRPIQKEERTEGGIIIPEKAKDREQMAMERGTCIAMGELAFTLGTPGKPDFFVGEGRECLGKTVAYQRYAGDLVDGADGIKYRVMPAADIIAILDKEQAQ